jgi:hypothetical protein
MVLEGLTTADKWQMAAGAGIQLILFATITSVPSNVIIVQAMFVAALFLAYKYMLFVSEKEQAGKGQALKHLGYAVGISLVINVILCVVWGYWAQIAAQVGTMAQVNKFFALPSGLSLVIAVLAAVGNDTRKG